jgi:4-oxalocrotonate tautomerase
MPIVRIDLLPGRPPEVKQALVDRIVAAFGEVCGTKPEALEILFAEVARDDWFSGGQSYAARLAPKP